jgi:hypothetical protein
MSFYLLSYVLFSFISIPLSFSPLRPSGSALGLLLVFRTNTAYNRFWEGRRIWERILTSLRDLGRMTVVYGDVIESTRVERILHLLCAFPLGLSLLVMLYFHIYALAYSRFARYVRILSCSYDDDNLSTFVYIRHHSLRGTSVSSYMLSITLTFPCLSISHSTAGARTRL